MTTAVKDFKIADIGLADFGHGKIASGRLHFVKKVGDYGEVQRLSKEDKFEKQWVELTH